MKLRTFKVFTLDRLTLYGGMCLLATGLVAKAFHYNLIVKKITLPTPFMVAALLMAAALWTIASVLFWTRWQFKKQISYYTSQGLAVIGADKDVVRVRSAVEAVIEETIAFWVWWDAPSARKSEAIIREYMNGGVLRFSRAVLDARVPGGVQYKALGLASGNWASVVWRASDNISHVLQLVRHEIGHVCLNALGVVDADGETQHRVMNEAKFNH